MQQNSLLDDLIDRLDVMDPTDRAFIVEAAIKETAHMPWVPNPGPQTAAYFCEADELFYGGSAGGGKSDLGIGLAMTAHQRSLILRREREQVYDLFERIGEIADTDKGRNAQQLRWDIGDRMIRCGGVKQEKDKQKHKGRPYDLYVFDEISDFLQSQYEFIITWNRTATPGQRCRVLATGNPPTTPEGLWVIQRWAAWLDPKHPNPAKEGELRWYLVDKEGHEREVDGPGPHTLEYADGSTETIAARSRSFIRAKLTDNPYLMATDYAKQLDTLPAELRAAYRDGRFDLALEDSPSQVIPTSWVIAAQKRWKERQQPNIPMCAIGVDVAQGGKDETVLACRYDGWYAPLVAVPGKDTPSGASVVALIIQHRRNAALPIIDLGGGYGGATKEKLDENQIKCVGYRGAAASTARSACGNFVFANKRAEAYWKFREALDPDKQGSSEMALPDDPKMVADLCAPTFKVKRGKNGLEITIESKEDITDRLGRSPDRGDAVIMSWTDGDKADTHSQIWNRNRGLRGQMPEVKMGHSSQRRTRH